MHDDGVDVETRAAKRMIVIFAERESCDCMFSEFNGCIPNLKHYKDILASDAQLYPSEDALSVEEFTRWYAHHPEFCMVWTHEDTVLGSFAVAPLTKDAWTRLVRGECSEKDVTTPECVFDASRDSEVGLHIYHADKHVDAWRTHMGNKRLAVHAYTSLITVLKALQTRYSHVRVCGLSGLAVTAAGKRMLEYFGCTEHPDYLCTDSIWQHSSTKSRIVTATPPSQDWHLVHPCSMLILFPH
jgi:hypothetical protein